jgi:Mn2+/Fe2+ NRAMP family transporter
VLRLKEIFSVIALGILVTATGVGAGDLATAAFAGNKLGTAVLWAVLLGAFLKFVLNEGLMRWQLATGETLLEGAVHHLGVMVPIVFLPYLLLWSFFVGSALMSACGVTMHAIWPIFDDPDRSKVVFGIAHGLLGLVLVLLGGFPLFERVMTVCIGFMFVCVLLTAILVCEDWGAVIQGMVVPRIPADVHGTLTSAVSTDGLRWTIALMGGVGGTLTVLCYGYWMREKGRRSPGNIKTCRIDLGFAYLATAVFGLAMVIIGSTIQVEGKGARLVVNLADKLAEPLGDIGRWTFLIGAWGAVFSSLLGVWQAVPFIFTDFYTLIRSKEQTLNTGGPTDALKSIDANNPVYRFYLFALTLIPMIGLLYSFKSIQLLYAIIGAMFMPMLALVLLLLNGRSEWVGELKNRWSTALVLLFVLIAFACASFFDLEKKFKPTSESPKLQFASCREPNF